MKRLLLLCSLSFGCLPAFNQPTVQNLGTCKHLSTLGLTIDAKEPGLAVNFVTVTVHNPSPVGRAVRLSCAYGAHGRGTPLLVRPETDARVVLAVAKPGLFDTKLTCSITEEQ